MMAPVAEAGMAHSAPFNRIYSNPASRIAYERPWLLVLAALANPCFLLVSGNYSFTRSLVSSPAPAAGSGVPPVAVNEAPLPLRQAPRP